MASVIAEVNRNTKKKHKAFQPEDFMPKMGKAEKKKKPEKAELQEKINAAMMAFGGTMGVTNG